MVNNFSKRKLISIVSFLLLILPIAVSAADKEYVSKFINQSKQKNSQGFRLVKTKSWPSDACLTDTGKEILNPGESTTLKIKDDPKCNESGVGYSIYRMEDTKNAHLLGYVSHRFADGKFSLQVSRFCLDDKCVFNDLDPEQNR